MGLKVTLYARGFLQGKNDTTRQAAQATFITAQGSNSVAAQKKLASTQSNYYITFDVSPDINESASANYAELSDIRAPASILIYTGSPSRTFSINTKLVSRTVDEAAYNTRVLNVLRSWRMPEALTGGFNQAIPTILSLDGYGSMFKAIPVVMTSLTIDIQSEFDVIGGQSIGNAPAFVPIVVPVSISLKECHNTEADYDALNQFDIVKFRAGTLEKW